MHLSQDQLHSFGAALAGALERGSIVTANCRRKDGTPVAMLGLIHHKLGEKPWFVPMAEIVGPGESESYLPPTVEDNPPLQAEPESVAPIKLILPPSAKFERPADGRSTPVEDAD